MRFDAKHRFHGYPEGVAAVLSDPAFYADLDLPDVSRPTIVEDRRTGDLSVVVLRYEFVGSLDTIARRLLGTHRLAWVQEVRITSSAGSGELSFRAEADPRRLRGTASFTLGYENDLTVRRLSGEVVISVPVIGPQAERRIVPGLLRRLDIEAAAVERLVAGDGHS